jgi:hypothetical protein
VKGSDLKWGKMMEEMKMIKRIRRGGEDEKELADRE